MTVFAIIPITGSTELGATLTTKFAERFISVGTAWLVSYEGTSRQLSQELGLEDDATSTSAVVIAAQSYWGRGKVDLWEWIKSNWERTDGGS